MDAKILVIDDEVDIREMIEILLMEEGFQVAQLAEVYGIEPVLILKPDLIILDAKIPRLGGVKFSQMLRSHPFTQNIPIIAFSGAAPRELNGMRYDAFLAKPFDVAELVAQVNSLLAPAAPESHPAALAG